MHRHHGQMNNDVETFIVSRSPDDVNAYFSRYRGAHLEGNVDDETDHVDRCWVPSCMRYGTDHPPEATGLAMDAYARGALIINFMFLVRFLRLIFYGNTNIYFIR